MRSLAGGESVAAHLALAEMFEKLERADAAGRHYRAAAKLRGTVAQQA